MAVVAANPVIALLVPIGEGPEFDVFTVNIAAWDVPETGPARPVAAIDLPSDAAILDLYEGNVFPLAGGAPYRSIQAWKEALRKKRADASLSV